jgi:hypothetical protein
MRLMSDVLKIEPSVGFLAFEPAPDAPARRFIGAERVPAGGTAALSRLLAAAVGGASLAAVCAARERSMTSLRKAFELEERRVRCSSGTVSRFFSRKPSVS